MVLVYCDLIVGLIEHRSGPSVDPDTIQHRFEVYTVLLKLPPNMSRDGTTAQAAIAVTA